MKQKREREEPCEVCGHYHDYHGGEPCSVCGHRLETGPSDAHAGPPPKPPSAFPSEVVPGFLFLGTYDHASRQEILKTLGVTHILNTVPSCPPLYKNSFTYHTVSASPPPLDECYAFLEEVQRKGSRVLVHCMSGLSRSPAVVIYYLMRRNSWRLSEAYRWVKDRRPVIAITQNDAQRLQAAEAQLMGLNASGFQVPVGQQPAGDGAPGAAPFGWPAFGGGWAGGGAPPAGGALQPGQPPVLNFAGPPSSGAFVFGARQGQQAQQEQQAEMAD